MRRLLTLLATGLLLSASGTVQGEEQSTSPIRTPPQAPVRPAGSGAGSEYDGVVVKQEQAAANDLPATLTIDETRVIGPASPLLFGTNQAWLPQERLMTGGPDGQPHPGFSALARGLPMPLNRMAGSDSAHFRWKAAIGPLAERTAIANEYRNSCVRRLGPVEWIRTVRGIDPTARFSWTFNCLAEEPADHADLAHFLTGVPGARRDGGKDWAAQRVAYGLVEPVEVVIWEIGNEVDHGSAHAQRFPDATAYATYAARTIAAVRAVQPDAVFAVHAATSPWSWGKRHAGDWKDWHRTVLRTVGKDIGWLVLHPYYCGLPISEMERYLDVLRDDCVKLVPGHPIRLYISEHARWPEQEPGKPWKQSWFNTHSLGGCLATGQFLTRMLNRPEVGAAAYHALTAGPWGLFYDHDSVSGAQVPPWRTGMADLLTAFRPVHGGEVVATSLSGACTAADDPAATCAVAAVRQGQALVLVLVNREPLAARPLTLSMQGRWRLAGGMALTAPSLESANRADASLIAMEPIPSGQGQFQTWTLPARQMAVLTLESMP